MTAFENAKKFFEACETSAGWAGCKQYVAENATFFAQSEALADTDTVVAYCEGMAAFGKITAPGSSYDLHTASYDPETRTAVFFATYHAKHTGEGGPVPPTHKETHSHYVYVLTMNKDDKVEKMVKIWNEFWTGKELGWII